jgi:hypothetical protein
MLFEESNHPRAAQGHLLSNEGAGGNVRINGRGLIMRRILGAVFLVLCMLAPLSIRDAIAARAAVGQCKSYANAHHCHAKYDRHNKSCLCQ